MDSLIERALAADIADSVDAVTAAGLAEVGRQADVIVGAGPLPGTPEWVAEEGTEIPATRQLAWQLTSVRLQLAAGLDCSDTIVVLRAGGVTWSLIARAAGITRQAAHERWGGRVRDVLDRYGDGMPDSVADDEPPTG
ncbi:hypothetical protein ACFWPA_11830 [Rhodococcus sp. NPDC058505]|uniref:hypothetical protein n=1 Tax=Rhodococcus sp. NPDC058505 TaxID=3346531 RepID=UPI0036513736